MTVDAVVPAFASFATQLPDCGSTTRVSEAPAPEPDVFHPERSVSKPGLRTKLTARAAVAVLPAFVPVTVYAPPVGAVQTFPLQDPPGAIVNVVEPVTSPVELPYWSRPWTVYACDAPAGIVADTGVSSIRSSTAEVTISAAVAVIPA